MRYVQRKRHGLKRIKPGYFNPPTDRPIFVPGINWLQILVTGYERDACTGTLVLVDNPRAKKPAKSAAEEGKILKKVLDLWGRKVIHIWDRGLAGSPWSKLALDHQLRFILRWNKNYHLIGPDGRKHEVWKIARGKRSWEYQHKYLGYAQTLLSKDRRHCSAHSFTRR